jgi:hypothetical protein
MHGRYQLYISYVIQRPEGHTHASDLVEFPMPKYSFYLDNSTQQVVQWAASQQAQLSEGEKIVILNFFNVPIIK